MAEIHTNHLFSLSLKISENQNLGKTPFGDRRVAVIDGGTFEGARLRGTVLKGGSDWLLGRTDGALQLDVRLTLKTDDGELIGMTYRGVRHGPIDVIERLNRGDPVDASEYYFRTAPFFETSSTKYGWLNRVVAVATGHRPPAGLLLYDVFEVL